MSLEKLVVRVFAGLALLFLLITLAYYPPSHALMPAVFFMMFVIGDMLLPSKTIGEEKGWRKLAIKIVTFLLILAIAGTAAILIALWRHGPFSRLG